MINAFAYSANPARILFGGGRLAELPAEIDRLGLQRVLVLATPQQAADAEALAEGLGDRVVGTFTRAAMHTPVEVTERALAVVAELEVDGLVAVGGGSTTGLAKAIAFRTDLPQIVAPTTYAGSEMTGILGETEAGTKVTRSSPRVLAEVVIYDVDLTLTLPARISGTSGINAIAHAVEAMYARDRNPVTSLLALEAVEVLSSALPRISDDLTDREARTGALYGAWLAGTCLGSVGMSLHHKLCHTLGGSFDLPHSETHAVLLPHAVAYNAPAIGDVVARLSDVLGGGNPASALYDLAGRVGAKRSLRELGMREADIDEATRRALSNPYWNPRALDDEAIRDLIARAWAGEAPLMEG